MTTNTMTIPTMEATAQLGDASVQAIELATFRFAWPERFKGFVILHLNFPQAAGIRPSTQVWAVANEAMVQGDPNAGAKLGSAAFTMHNIVTSNDRISVMIDIANPVPLPILIDYLIHRQ